MPRISVIIPVYNAQNYVRKCIESVLYQPMKDIEIICVNSGSTDNSSDILDEYSRHYQQIKVIHENYQHLGPSRNSGMNIASGEYIHFLDADDFLVKNAYEAVYDEAKRLNADILKFRVHTMDALTGQIVHDTIYNLSQISKGYFGKVIDFLNYPEAFTPRGISYPPWNSLFKRSFFSDNKIQFDGMHSFEDITFYYMVLLNAKRVVYSDDYVLTYRKNNPTSLVSGCLNYFECLFEVYRFLDERTRFLPHSLRYLILGIELKTMFYWYIHSRESGQNWEYIRSETHRFIDKINSNDFIEIILTERWNCYYRKNMSASSQPLLKSLNTADDRISILKQAYYEQHFPLNLVERESKIAIYGAGGYGKIAVAIMDEMDYGKPYIWVDRNYKLISDDNHEISSPTEIKKNNFDFVVIAIEDKGIIKDVHEFLLNNGIPRNKIVWHDTELNVWVKE
ncbi:MAG: glycosyltransferase [Bacteroidales bacterium]|nr:glycosyltransferase [Bacteroidales bacterium]